MPGGLLFLFDRNKLRYFRKDGHNWRKKKDGKTIREAHEKLKVGFCLKYMGVTDSNQSILKMPTLGTFLKHLS